MTILTIVFCATGFLVCLGINRVFELYEERVPGKVQHKIYSITKDLPKLVVGLAIYISLWSGIGALVLYLVALLIGMADRVSSAVSWAPGLVGGILSLFLIDYWSTPHRSEPPVARGRNFKAQQKPSIRRAETCGTRGRVIRSYRDIS